MGPEARTDPRWNPNWLSSNQKCFAPLSYCNGGGRLGQEKKAKVTSAESHHSAGSAAVRTKVLFVCFYFVFKTKHVLLARTSSRM